MVAALLAGMRAPRGGVLLGGNALVIEGAGASYYGIRLSALTRDSLIYDNKIACAWTDAQGAPFTTSLRRPAACR